MHLLRTRGAANRVVSFGLAGGACGIVFVLAIWLVTTYSKPGPLEDFLTPCLTWLFALSYKAGHLWSCCFPGTASSPRIVMVVVPLVAWIFQWMLIGAIVGWGSWRISKALDAHRPAA